MDCPTKQPFYGKPILDSLNPQVCSFVYMPAKRRLLAMRGSWTPPHHATSDIIGVVLEILELET